MTRPSRLTTRIGASDPQYERLLEQRQVLTTRYEYLKAIVCARYSMSEVGFNYRFSFDSLQPIDVCQLHIDTDHLPVGPLVGLPPQKEVYSQEFEQSWELRERGILHALADLKKFMVVTWDRDYKIHGWKTMFANLKKEYVSKELVPCLVGMDTPQGVNGTNILDST